MLCNFHRLQYPNALKTNHIFPVTQSNGSVGGFCHIWNVLLLGGHAYGMAINKPCIFIASAVQVLY